jgi:hypothetical protein
MEILDAPEEDVVIALTLISDYSGPTTTAAFRVAWEPLLANQPSLQDALVTRQTRSTKLPTISDPRRKQVIFVPPGSSSTSASAWRNFVL